MSEAEEQVAVRGPEDDEEEQGNGAESGSEGDEGSGGEDGSGEE